MLRQDGKDEKFINRQQGNPETFENTVHIIILLEVKYWDMVWDGRVWRPLEFHRTWNIFVFPV